VALINTLFITVEHGVLKTVEHGVLKLLGAAGGLPQGFSPSASIGGSACGFTTWISETSVTARTPQVPTKLQFSAS